MRMIFLGLLLTTAACAQSQNREVQSSDALNIKTIKSDSMEIATFGAGCFWCVEAVFQQINGVDTVVSGYMGGKIPNPTYREVCSGLTGHAEVIQIRFNPAVVSFTQLMEVFYGTHDPTTLNRQGADVGTQYRSAIFYHNENQKKQAEEIKSKLNGAKAFPNPIITEISPSTTFYKAEDYHQNYYRLNSEQGYCRVVIKPKMDKLQKVFGEYLKK